MRPNTERAVVAIAAQIGARLAPAARALLTEILSVSSNACVNLGLCPDGKGPLGSSGDEHSCRTLCRWSTASVEFQGTTPLKLLVTSALCPVITAHLGQLREDCWTVRVTRLTTVHVPNAATNRSKQHNVNCTAEAQFTLRCSPCHVMIHAWASHTCGACIRGQKSDRPEQYTSPQPPWPRQLTKSSPKLCLLVQQPRQRTGIS